MKISVVRHAALAGLGVSLLAGTLHAEVPNFELNAGLGYYLFETDRDLEDDAFWGLGLGYAINPEWTLEAWWTEFKLDVDSTGANLDGEELRLDALYHFATTESLKPYLVFGVGDAEYDVDTGAVDETRINLGFGMKKSLSERLRLRGDFRLFNSLDHELTDFGIQVGLNYVFGAAAARSPSPATLDSDGDGVQDGNDRCPGTPAGVMVDAQGCPLDSDGDGVADYRDKCPDTAANLKVDGDGCPVPLTENVSIELKVNFAHDSAEVQTRYLPAVQGVADFMRSYPDTTVEIQGHTDSTGAAAYNQKLSQRRAQAVASLLVSRFGIAESRVTARGYGEEQLIASDDTAAGRETNRRVVAEIHTQVKTLQQR